MKTVSQGNLIGARREGSRLFFKSVNISDRKLFYTSFFGSLGLQFLLANYISLGKSALQICGHANNVRESIYVYSREDIHA